MHRVCEEKHNKAGRGRRRKKKEKRVKGKEAENLNVTLAARKQFFLISLLLSLYITGKIIIYCLSLPRLHSLRLSWVRSSEYFTLFLSRTTEQRRKRERERERERERDFLFSSLLSANDTPNSCAGELALNLVFCLHAICQMREATYYIPKLRGIQGLTRQEEEDEEKKRKSLIHCTQWDTN